MNRKTRTDSTATVVSAGMVLLALLGVLTIFHGPLAALLFPPVVAPESFAGPPATAPAAR